MLKAVSEADANNIKHVAYHVETRIWGWSVETCCTDPQHL